MIAGEDADAELGSPKKKRRRLERDEALPLVCSKPAWIKWQALGNGVEMEYKKRKYVKGVHGMEEKLMTAMVNNTKKASSDRACSGGDGGGGGGEGGTKTTGLSSGADVGKPPPRIANLLSAADMCILVFSLIGAGKFLVLFFIISFFHFFSKLPLRTRSRYANR